MSLNDIIIELYRLAETRTWNGEKSDEALFVAIEAMEQIWSLRLAEQRKNVRSSGGVKKQLRLWS